MDCITKDERGTEILLDYCTGSLEAARTVEVDRHVQVCADCRKLVAEQRAVFQAMDSWTLPEVSAGFDNRLYARISVERRSFSSIFRSWWKPAIPLALAAAALSVLLVVKTSAPVANHPGMEKAELEQVEQALDDMDMLAPAAM
jgi:anti-sigma factor RsiW